MSGDPRADRPVARRVFTAQDVLQVLRDGGRELVVSPDDRLTALARDTARERDVAIVTAGAHLDHRYAAAAPPGWPTPAGPRSAPPGPSPAPPGPASPVPRSAPAGEPRLTHVRDIGRLSLDPFPADLGRPEMDVRLRDVVTGRDGIPMAAGLLSLRAGSFPWRLDYDEVEYVLEGELHITTATQQVVGLPGDVIVVPKGSSITFGTPSWAKFFYVTYPADWNPA